MPVAGAPGLLSIHISNHRTDKQRVHLTPFKLCTLGGCDEEFTELNTSRGVQILWDESIVDHGDLWSRAEYLAEGVHNVLKPLMFARVQPGWVGDQMGRVYERTEKFPRALNNKSGLPECRCPVAVPWEKGAEDVKEVEGYKKNDPGRLVCVVEPAFKPIILHSDDEKKQTQEGRRGGRRFMWLQPRMEYQVRLLGPGAEEWKVVGVEIMWSEAANDKEANHKRLKKWTIWPPARNCVPVGVMKEEKWMEAKSGEEEEVHLHMSAKQTVDTLAEAKEDSAVNVAEEMKDEEEMEGLRRRAEDSSHVGGGDDTAEISLPHPSLPRRPKRKVSSGIVDSEDVVSGPRLRLSRFIRAHFFRGHRVRTARSPRRTPSLSLTSVIGSVCIGCLGCPCVGVALCIGCLNGSVCSSIKSCFYSKAAEMQTSVVTLIKEEEKKVENDMPVHISSDGITFSEPHLDVDTDMELIFAAGLTAGAGGRCQ